MWRFALSLVVERICLGLAGSQHGAPVCDRHHGCDETEAPALLQAAAAEARDRHGGLNARKVKKIAFVHVPKTAGTSMNTALERISKDAGMIFANGQWNPARMAPMAHYALEGGMPTIVVGEFLGESYKDLLRAQGSGAVQLWTMLRNPVMRAMSQAWHLELSHNLENFTTMPRLFSRSACNLTVPQLCTHGVEDLDTCSSKCKVGGSPNCCGRFQSHEVQVLGEAFSAGEGYAAAPPRLPDARWLERETTLDFDGGLRAIMGQPGGNADANPSSAHINLLSLRTAINRILNGTLQIGVTEYFQASVCLFLDDTFGAESGTHALFETCCQTIDQPGCPFLRHFNVHVKPGDFYLKRYLQTELVQNEILESNAEACIMYSLGRKVFIERVRRMEAHRGVQVLDRDVSDEWSCKEWLSEYRASAR